MDFFNTCIKCFGKKDEMNEIKNYYKRGYGFAHIYLRLKNPLLYGAPSYKSGVQKVNSRGAYRWNIDAGLHWMAAQKNPCPFGKLH